MNFFKPFSLPLNWRWKLHRSWTWKKTRFHLPTLTIQKNNSSLHPLPRKKGDILPPRHLCNSSSYLLIAPRSLETFSFSFSYRRFHSSAVSSSFTTTTFLMVLALKNCDNDQVKRRNQRELLGVGRCSKTARGPLYDISSRTITWLPTPSSYQIKPWEYAPYMSCTQMWKEVLTIT